MNKLTVKDLFELRKERTLIQIYADSPQEAAACEAAGIEMVMTSDGSDVATFRKAAPNVFLSYGLPYRVQASPTETLHAAYEVLNAGADAVYCAQGLSHVKALADEAIPVWGHVGFIPHKASWLGGFKAQGKTATDALKIFADAIAYQDAGAIGIEVEIIPSEVANELSKRLNILTIGMGSGSGCNAQYLFATDILGTNRGHIPRHAKVYRNHKAEYERLYHDAVAAFKEFRADVDSSVYPSENHCLRMKDGEFQIFLNELDAH